MIFEENHGFSKKIEDVRRKSAKTKISHIVRNDPKWVRKYETYFSKNAEHRKLNRKPDTKVTTYHVY